MDPSNKIYASFLARFFATSVDWIITSICINAVVRIILLFFPLDSLSSSMIYIALYLYVVPLYHIFFVYKYGKTLGKWFMGLEIVKEEGKITFLDALRRETILKPLSMLLLGLGIFYMFFNPKRQTFYDKRLGLVVLVKSKLSSLKIVVVIITGVVYFLYLLNFVRIGYSFLNINYYRNRTDMIEGIRQKKEILMVVKDAKEIQFAEFGKKALENIELKQRELCSHQIINYILKKESCELEDLDMDSIKQLDKLYEDRIKEVIIIQSKMETR